MRAVCSESTFILVAEWEQSLHPGRLGQRFAHGRGPLNAEIAVRTTGRLTVGRNPRDRTNPAYQPFTTEKQERSFR